MADKEAGGLGETRSASYPPGLDGTNTTTRSVEEVLAPDIDYFRGAPDDGFAGGPGGKVVHDADAEARPA